MGSIHLDTAAAVQTQDTLDALRMWMTIPSVILLIVGIFVFKAILTFAGFLLSYGCPINKKVWSPTFVIITGLIPAGFNI